MQHRDKRRDEAEGLKEEMRVKDTDRGLAILQQLCYPNPRPLRDKSSHPKIEEKIMKE